MSGWWLVESQRMPGVYISQFTSDLHVNGNSDSDSGLNSGHRSKLTSTRTCVLLTQNEPNTVFAMIRTPTTCKYDHCSASVGSPAAEYDTLLLLNGNHFVLCAIIILLLDVFAA